MTSNFQEISNGSFRKYWGNVSPGVIRAAQKVPVNSIFWKLISHSLPPFSCFHSFKIIGKKKIIKCKTAELRAMSYVMFCRIQQHRDAEENNDFFFFFFWNQGMMKSNIILEKIIKKRLLLLQSKRQIHRFKLWEDSEWWKFFFFAGM